MRTINLKSLLLALALALLALSLAGGWFDLSRIVDSDLVLFGSAVAFILSRWIRAPLTPAHTLADNIENDPLLNSPAAWEPIAATSASFKTQRLVRRSDGSLSVQTTLSSRLFHLVFVIIGALLMFVALTLVWLMEGVARFVALIPAAAGGAFVWMAVGGVERKEFAVFDRVRMEFLTSPGGQGPGPVRGQAGDRVPFDQVHGLQLLKVVHGSAHFVKGPGRGSRFIAYELNLLLNDGKRVNVMSHGDLPSMILDAKGLSERLGVPLWHRV